jgi:tetratricopeptide (TPR) repeat protein
MTENILQRYAALMREGESLHGAGRFVEALHILLKALELSPGEPGALLDIGACLHELGRFEEALHAYGAALGKDPGFAAAYNNRGTTHLALAHYEDAAKDFLHALELGLGKPNVYAALASALQALGRLDEARFCCEEALLLNPQHAEAHWNLALLLLLEGDYRRGWSEFEWRWRKAGFTSWQRTFDRPLWDGSPLGGCTILLHAEQGFGDALQFARYLPLVAARGAEVVVECHRELVTLFARIEGVRTALPFGAALPPFDLHAPFMTLPLIFGTTLGSVPGQAPYISADPARAGVWQQRLADFPGLRVGLVWAGNAAQKKDRERSLPFAALAPLWSVPAEFFSLQLGEANLAFAQPPPHNRHDLTSHIKDFDDTAAFIAGLDLVVCACTAVAHLAGALGKPVFLLLAWAPDWRWLLEREDSPWYPTLRIFRQKAPGDWAVPVARVAKAIQEITGTRGIALHQARLASAHPPAARKRRDTKASRVQLSYGLELHERGMLLEAEKCLRYAFALSPGDFLAAKCLGLFLVETERFEEAAALYREFLRGAPDTPDILLCLGEALQALGNLDEAEECLRKAVRRAPGNADAAYRLGILHHMKNEPERALAWFARSDSLAPENSKTLLNIGISRQSMGQVREAQPCFEKSLSIDPGYALARWNLAQVQLLQGNFADGFANFAARFEKPNPVSRKYRGLRAWDGEDLRGKRIVVYAEQAFGDVIQFARYPTLLARLGGEVHFDCGFESLTGLLKTVEGVRGVFAGEGKAPVADYQVALLDLPRLLGTTIDTIPAEVPYLTASPEKLRHWKERLRAPEGVRIGLVWAGRKEPDPNRSALLEQFAPLARVSGITWYSLQLGEETSQLATAPRGLDIADLGPLLADFEETAAAMQQLDLVISIDTASAHLAGALGRPVWVLLPFAPDWRWMLDRDDSPWYPTMRLFRQQLRGDWSHPVAQVEGLLRLLFHPIDKSLALE